MVNALPQAVQAVRQVPRATAALQSVEEPGRPQHGRKRPLGSVRVALCTREERSGCRPEPCSGAGVRACTSANKVAHPETLNAQADARVAPHQAGSAAVQVPAQSAAPCVTGFNFISTRGRDPDVSGTLSSWRPCSSCFPKAASSTPSWRRASTRCSGSIARSTPRSVLILPHAMRRVMHEQCTAYLAMACTMECAAWWTTETRVQVLEAERAAALQELVQELGGVAKLGRAVAEVLLAPARRLA